MVSIDKASDNEAENADNGVGAGAMANDSPGLGKGTFAKAIRARSRG